MEQEANRACRPPRLGFPRLTERFLLSQVEGKTHRDEGEHERRRREQGSWPSAVVQRIAARTSGILGERVWSASMNGIGVMSNRAAPELSVTVVGVDKPSTSGRATPASTGVTKPIQSDDSQGVRSGTGTRDGAARRGRPPSDRASRRRRARRVPRSAPRDPPKPHVRRRHKVGDHVVDPDRLRGRLEPRRTDHRGQPLHG